MIIQKYPLDYYINRMESGSFAFVRYGDGEFFCIQGKKGQNCDGHQYFPEMGVALKESLAGEHPDYIRSISSIARDSIGDVVLSQYRTEWHYTDVFVEATLAGKLYPFIEFLRSKKVLYVAPAHLTGFLQITLDADVLTIPTKNAFLQLDKIYSDITDVISEYDVFCMSGGPPTKIILHRLWFKDGIQDKVLLDLGSIWDGFVGVNSRSYHRKLNNQGYQLNLRAAPS